MTERWHTDWCASVRGQRCNCGIADETLQAEVAKAIKQIEAGDYEFDDQLDD